MPAERCSKKAWTESSGDSGSDDITTTVQAWAVPYNIGKASRSRGDKDSMIPYLVLFLAALSRLVPHALHGTGLNITAVGGGLLFFGSRRPRWQALAAAAVMALTDVYLTRAAGYTFHVRAYVVTWVWYAAICLIGAGLLRKVTVLRVSAAVVSSATGFYLLSNFVVWAGSGMYPHNAGGLFTCYTLALPFYGNDLVSTALTSGILFGLPVVASQLVKLLEGSSEQRPVL